MPAQTRKLTWIGLALIVVMAGILVWWMPAERTLGQGVKAVYVHVALTQAGMLGLLVAGLLGIGVLITSGEALHRWMQAAARVGLALYAGGFVFSLLAQITSWGGIAWQEPRVVAALNILAVAIIVQVVIVWLPDGDHWPRVRGLLYAALAAYLLWATGTADDVLHPSAAIRTSPSSAIRLAYLGLLGLAILGAGLLTWAFAAQGGKKTEG